MHVASAPRKTAAQSARFVGPASVPASTGNAAVDAFAPLLAYDNRLYNVAFRILGDREDALDAVQDAYLQAFKGFHRFRGDSQPFTWLCRITMNECARRGGKRTARRKREIELAILEENGMELSVEDGAFALLDRSRTTQAVHKAVQALPASYRQMVLLRYFDSLSYREVADACDCPVGTVKSRISRAHERLKGSLTPELLGEFA